MTSGWGAGGGQVAVAGGQVAVAGGQLVGN